MRALWGDQTGAAYSKVLSARWLGNVAIGKLKKNGDSVSDPRFSYAVKSNRAAYFATSAVCSSVRTVIKDVAKLHESSSALPSLV